MGGPGICSRLLLTLVAVVARWSVPRRVVARAVRRGFGTAAGESACPQRPDDRHGAYWMSKATPHALRGIAALLVVPIWAEFGRRTGNDERGEGDVVDLPPRTTVMEIGSPGASEDPDVWGYAPASTRAGSS